MLVRGPSLPSRYLGMTLVLILYLYIKCLRTGVRDGIFKHPRMDSKESRFIAYPRILGGGGGGGVVAVGPQPKTSEKLRRKNLRGTFN